MGTERLFREPNTRVLEHDRTPGTDEIWNFRETLLVRTEYLGGGNLIGGKRVLLGVDLVDGLFWELFPTSGECTLWAAAEGLRVVAPVDSGGGGLQ